MSASPDSERRIQANRRNAKRSTGPRSAEGKATSSQNARAHGLFAQQLALSDEDVTQLFQLRQSMLDSFHPINRMEDLLVERIVAATWKLQRIANVEQTLYTLKTETIDSCGDEQLRRSLAVEPKQRVKVARNDWRLIGPPLPSSVITALLLKSDDSLLIKLAVHEQRLENSIHRCVRQLRQLRKDRAQTSDEDDNHQDEPDARNVVSPEETFSPDRDRFCHRGCSRPLHASPATEQTPPAEDGRGYSEKDYASKLRNEPSAADVEKFIDPIVSVNPDILCSGGCSRPLPASPATEQTPPAEDGRGYRKDNASKLRNEPGAADVAKFIEPIVRVNPDILCSGGCPQPLPASQVTDRKPKAEDGEDYNEFDANAKTPSQPNAVVDHLPVAATPASPITPAARVETSQNPEWATPASQLLENRRRAKPHPSVASPQSKSDVQLTESADAPIFQNEPNPPLQLPQPPTATAA